MNFLLKPRIAEPDFSILIGDEDTADSIIRCPSPRKFLLRSPLCRERLAIHNMAGRE